LHFIGQQNHDQVSGFGCIRNRVNFQTGFFSFSYRFTAGIQPNNNVHATIFKIEGVGVTLRTVADDCDRFIGE